MSESVITIKVPILVFPSNDRSMTEHHDLFAQAQHYQEILSVVYDREFDPRLLDSKDNVIFFFKTLPSWLPIKTNATVVLVIKGHIPNARFDYHEHDLRYFREISKYLMRPRFILSESPNQADTLSCFTRTPPNYRFYLGYSHLVYGKPYLGLRWTGLQSMESFYQQLPYEIVGYGQPVGRREDVIRWLSDHLGKKFKWFPSLWGKERAEVLRSSKYVFHASCSHIGSTKLPISRIMESGAGSATIITDHQDVWPLSGGDEDMVWLDKRPDRDGFLEQIDRILKYDASSIHTMAKKTFQVATRHTIEDAVSKTFDGLHFS